MVDYHKAGLLVLRDGCLLLCRKRHTTALLILPGGRFEAGETPEECIGREVQEELGNIGVGELVFLGTYSDAAAGGAGKIVQIELYRGDLLGEPSAQSEIQELVWFGRHDDRGQLAPSIANKILPDLIARGILPW